MSIWIRGGAAIILPPSSIEVFAIVAAIQQIPFPGEPKGENTEFIYGQHQTYRHQ